LTEINVPKNALVFHWGGSWRTLDYYTLLRICGVVEKTLGISLGPHDWIVMSLGMEKIEDLEPRTTYLLIPKVS
jgi:hypothetical protein